MKHFSRLLFLLLAPAAAIAQPTITQADLPNVGTFWANIGDTTTVLNITPAGPNQTWNYAAQLSNPTDTAYNAFVSPSATPTAYQQAFPNANVAVYEPADSVGVFYQRTNSGFYLDGIYIGSSTSGGLNKLDFNPDELLIPTPFSYNGTRNHTAKLSFSVQQMGTTITFVQYIYQSYLADAYGSLTTPAGTFSNTLRIKNTNYNVDTTYADIAGTMVPIAFNGPHDTTSAFIWVQNGSQALLMQLQQDMANPSSSLPGGASYLDYTLLPPPVAAAEAINTPQVQPYPNPAISFVRFPIEAEGAESLVIYDMLGKPVATEKVRGINLLTYGTSQLAAGLYSYSVQGKDGAELQKGRFSVVK